MIQRGQDPKIFKKIKSFMEANEQLENIVEEEKFGPYNKNSGRVSQIVSNYFSMKLTAPIYIDYVILFFKRVLKIILLYILVLNQVY
jgi:hypothetical protein